MFPGNGRIRFDMIEKASFSTMVWGHSYLLSVLTWGWLSGIHNQLTVPCVVFEDASVTIEPTRSNVCYRKAISVVDKS